MILATVGSVSARLRPMFAVTAILVVTLASPERALPLAAQTAAPLVGIFPFKIISPNRAELEGGRLENGLAGLLVARAQAAGGVRVKSLAWPERSTTGGLQPASFDALVSVARREGVDAFVLATVAALDMAPAETRTGRTLGRIGGVLGVPVERDASVKATVALEGGLVDAWTGQVLAPLSSSHVSAPAPYGGPAVAELVSAGVPSAAFSRSPVGEAMAESMAALAGQVIEAASRIGRDGRPPARQNAPAGLRLDRAEYRFEIDRAADRWAAVEVHNAAAEPRRFVVHAESAGSLPADFMGAGSIDQPYALAPGAWKRVRLVVNAATFAGDEGRVTLRLYDVTRSGTSDLASLAPHDSAIATVSVAKTDFTLQVDRAGEVASTLGLRYRITNAGKDPIADFTVRPERGFASKVFIWPAVDDYVLEPGASVDVTIVPYLYSGFRRAEGRVVLSGAGRQQPLPVIVQVPAGRQVYRARGASSQIFAALLGFCTNTGGGDTDLPGPTAESPLCAFLANQIADATYFRGLYLNAPNWIRDPGQLQDWMFDQASAYNQDKYGKPPRVGGTTDATTGQSECSSYDYLPEPLRSIALEACQVHEQQHSDDAVDDSRMSDEEFFRHFRQSEIDAYQDQIDYLKQKQAELCGGAGLRPASDGIAAPRSAEARGFGRGAPMGTTRLLSIVPSSPVELRWGDPKAYFLSASFELPHSRSAYTPHDTLIRLNGTEVGRLTKMMPEGTYLFPIDPAILSPTGRNVVSVQTTGLNEAHYVLASSFKLIAPVTDAGRYVVAASQAEADRLYAQLTHINHDRPDVALIADPRSEIPARPADGQVVRLTVRAINLGERPSRGGRLRVFNYDPREQTAKGRVDLGTVETMLTSRVKQIARLGEVGSAVKIPPLKRLEAADLPVEITFRAGRTTRLYLAADADRDDFDRSNNVQTVTFVAPESESPLLGVDYPDLRTIPVVSTVLDLPAVPELQTYTTSALDSYLARVPGLRELQGVAGWLDWFKR